MPDSLGVTPWTVARQAPLSLGFSKQEYWSGLPCPPPGDLPDPGIQPMSHISCIGKWVLYLCATREALTVILKHPQETKPSDLLLLHYVDCALYLYHYDISSTSGHQALDPRDWKPLR